MFTSWGGSREGGKPACQSERRFRPTRSLQVSFLETELPGAHV